MGNNSSTYPHVKFTLPHAQIAIPTTNVEDVISTEVSFQAQSWNTGSDEPDFETGVVIDSESGRWGTAPAYHSARSNEDPP